MNQEDLHFHYNRERRLERAPENVRRAYEVGYTPNKGFIKGLTSNAGLRSILMAIVILTIAVLGTTYLGGNPESVTMNGVPVRLRAFPFEDNIYVTVVCAARDDWSGDPVPVQATVELLDAGDAVVFRRELAGVYSGKNLELRAVSPRTDVTEVRAHVIFDKTGRSLGSSVDRN